jgi:hypothetical protein
MRYVIAMIFAVVVAAVFTLHVGSPAATWAVDKMAFDNPDQVSDMHSFIFMATNFLGLLIGWGLGWMVAGPLAGGQRPQ